MIGSQDLSDIGSAALFQALLYRAQTPTCTHRQKKKERLNELLHTSDKP